MEIRGLTYSTIWADDCGESNEKRNDIGCVAYISDPMVDLEEFYEMIADNMAYHLARQYKFYAEYESLESDDEWPLYCEINLAPPTRPNGIWTTYNLE